MIILKAEARWGQTGQYIARIIGRDPKMTFRRVFLGRKDGSGRGSTAEVDEPGLYVEVDIDKKGNKEESYLAILPNKGLDFDKLKYFGRKDDSLIAKSIRKDEAMKIAKSLEDGFNIEDIVRLSVELTPDSDVISGPFRLGYSIVSPREREQARASASLESAEARCWEILQSLPARDAKKILGRLKARFKDPKESETNHETPND